MLDTKQLKYNSFFAFLILLNAIGLISFPISRICLFGILPFLTIVAFINNKDILFKNNTLVKNYSYFFFFYILISLFGVDLKHSLTVLPAFISTYIWVITISAFSTNYKYIKIYIFFYLLYLILNYYLGFTKFNFGLVDFSDERAGGLGLNANRFGYFLFFMTFILYVYGEICRKGKLRFIYRVLFIILPVSLSAYTAILTGSRQLLIIQIPFIIILLIIRYFKRFNFKAIATSTLIFLVLWLLVDSFDHIYTNSLLRNRMFEDISNDSRVNLFKLGLTIGFEHFFTGVGLGNYQLFSGGYLSHSSYTEAFSEGGFILLILYLTILLKFCNNQIIRYKKSMNSLFLIFFVFGCFYIIFNFFYVFWGFNIIMAFLFLIEQFSIILFNKNYKFF